MGKITQRHLEWIECLWETMTDNKGTEVLKLVDPNTGKIRILIKEKKND